jgi:hypothetical protein
VFVLRHVSGMDYLASRPGCEFSTDSSIGYALRFSTLEQAQEAERITPSMWTIEEVLDGNASQD